jgi:hypothetical protein
MVYTKKEKEVHDGMIYQYTVTSMIYYGIYTITEVHSHDGH